MLKIKKLENILEKRIIAVIRELKYENTKKIIEACYKGGVNVMEVTFTIPKAHEVISRLQEDLKNDDIIIGAGTVLDSETARMAISAGAEFIVSPGFDLETAKLCNRYQIPYMAGCMTITEIIKALEAGTDIIKLFPGSAFGPSIVKDIKAPLPQVPIMPTGGVSIDNVQEWIKNGVVAVGVGGSLTKLDEKMDFEKITTTAKAFIEKINEVK